MLRFATEVITPRYNVDLTSRYNVGLTWPKSYNVGFNANITWKLQREFLTWRYNVAFNAGSYNVVITWLFNVGV